MLITRYNYEEHFLLYADGELSPLEVEIVEQFVQVHPDLKEELDMLMDCKLIADMPVFFPKEKLYKQTIWDEENITQSQSQLLLLLDNELLAGDKKILEKSIAENPVLEQEWNTLQQTKLLAETVAHPHKEPLYKQKRIPTMMWWRWAAAAVVILGAGWFVVSKNSTIFPTETVGVVAKNEIITVPKSVQPQNLDSIQQPVQANGLTYHAQESETAENNTELPENSVADNKQPLEKAITNKTVSKENPIDEQKDATENTLAQNDNNPDNNDERQTLISHKTMISVDDASNVKPQKAPAKFIGSTKTSLVVKNKTSQTDNIASLQADADDNEYVHIAGARVKKQKLRGMFRNITRGIGRTFSNSKVVAATPMAVNN